MNIEDVLRIHWNVFADYQQKLPDSAQNAIANSNYAVLILEATFITVK